MAASRVWGVVASLVALALVAGILSGAAAAEELKTIGHGKPRYVPKTHEAWAGKGRVVGLIRECPGCEIDLLDAEGKEVKSVRIPAGGKAYELEWLAPGTYTVRVAARGYQPLTLKALEVKAKNDLRIDLEF